jgi:hypothetical protein
VATKAEVAQIYMVLGAAYPNFGRDGDERMFELSLKVYQEILVDIPFDVLQAAAQQHIAQNKWFPAIAELRELAVDLMTTQHSTAAEAWGEVLSVMRRPSLWPEHGIPFDGDYPLPIEAMFKDKLAYKVAMAIGWRDLCASENTMADRAHFLKAYEAAAQRESRNNLALPAVKQLRDKLTARTERPKELPQQSDITDKGNKRNDGRAKL